MDDNNILSYQPFEDTNEPLVSDLYHENSKLGPCDMSTYARISYFNNSSAGHDIVSRAAKLYTCAHRLALPAPMPLSCSMDTAIQNRKSSSRFNGVPITLEQVATILKNGNGATEFVKEKGINRRAIPSAGALYPTEVYLLPLDMPELDLGVYHYESSNHQLAKIIDEPAEPVLGRACKTGFALPTASAALIVSACFERQRIKYQERAYRFALMEAGHLTQNISLTCAALGLGALPVGGFMDDIVNNYIQIDSHDEASLYVILIGGLL